MNIDGTILRFDDCLSERPAPTGVDVLCKLQHFAIITYAVDPGRFKGLIPERFQLDTVWLGGEQKALMSVVPFIDVDFTSAVFPFPKFTMGQTNYRIYIIDSQTGERCVWFLGTTLDSWTLMVPRYAWNLPWYSGTVQFDCDVEQTPDGTVGRYARYRMATESQWAPAHVHLTQPADVPCELPGFPDWETGLVYLTHPLAGFYHRRDGRLGTYRVWHDRLMVQPAVLLSADFGLLSRMNLVSLEEQQTPHSVLIDPLNEFTIYLPPKVLEAS